MTPQLNNKNSHWIMIIIGVVIILLIWRLITLNHKKERPEQPTLVAVAKAKERDVPIFTSALGAVTPTYTITVRTQINGQLMRVAFTEGQMVKAGDLLAEIDSRPYEAQLKQYEGQLARDRAQYANAKVDFKRYRQLWKQNSISQQTYATQQALVKQLEGTIKTDEGLIQAIMVNLAYCKIRSHIAGRVGLRLIDPGNYVQTSDPNGIAVITKLNPITVIFSVAEDIIPDISQSLNEDRSLEVKVYDRQQKKLLAKGKLLTIDNQIDTTTGTVKLRAEFNNDNNALFPNQFVNIQLLLKILHDAITIPTSAIQHSTTKGDYVFLLKSNHTATVKPVVLGVTIGDTSTIKSGISLKDTVITDGSDKLTEGAKVRLPKSNSDSKRRSADS